MDCPYNLTDWRGQEIRHFASHEEKQPRVCKNTDKLLLGKCLSSEPLDFCHQVLLFYLVIWKCKFLGHDLRMHFKFLYAE